MHRHLTIHANNLQEIAQLLLVGRICYLKIKFVKEEKIIPDPNPSIVCLKSKIKIVTNPGTNTPVNTWDTLYFRKFGYEALT